MTTATETAASQAYQMLAWSYERHLRATNTSPRTIRTDMDAIGQLGAFLAGHGMPTDPAAIAREHVEAFVADVLARSKAFTAANRYRALNTWFK